MNVLEKKKTSVVELALTVMDMKALVYGSINMMHVCA